MQPSSDVATSISCRDITLCPCRFQLVAHDVATSISCRDISSSLLQSSNGCSWCCDINVMNCSFQLISSDVATSISYRDITSCLLYVALVVFDVATSMPYRDIIPLVSAQSSAAYLVIPVATCIKFPSILLMSRPHNWTVQTPKLQH